MSTMVARSSHVGGDVVVALHAGGAGGPLGRDPPDAVQAGPQQPVGLVLDPAGDVGVGRAAVGRVVLEAAVLGRVVGRGDHDAVGQVVAPVPVPGEDGQRQRRGRGRPVAGVDPHLDPVGGQHLQGGALGRLGQGVGVAAQEQRPVDPLGLPVAADGLGGGQDVGLVEGRLEGRPPVPRGPEGHLLGGLARVRPLLVVRRHQPVHVDQHRRLGRPPGPFAHRHPLTPLQKARRRYGTHPGPANPA